MIRQNLHMHSEFDDGHDSCGAMLEACFAAGMTSAGVALHSPLPYENDWSAADIKPFLAEMARQKALFAGRMKVYAGIELDILSLPLVKTSAFDYVIGAVHHLPVDMPPPSVDHMPEITRATLVRYFSGDADAYAQTYYEELAGLAEIPEVQICAHFDLLTKFDERFHFMRPDSQSYRRASLEAMERLAAAGKIFEVNTGAIARGWRSAPYPSEELLRALCGMHGRVTVSSDAHRVSDVTCAFRETEGLLRACGFTEIWQLADGEERPVFQPVPLDGDD